MNVIPLHEFISAYFKDNAEFARIHGCDRNSVYRMNRQNVHVSGNREKYTTWYPKDTNGDQISLFKRNEI